MTKSNKEPQSFYLAWATLLERYGVHIASLLTIFSLLLGWKVFQHINEEGIPLDFTPQSIFLDDGDMVQQLRTIEEEFGREDNDFLILIKGNGLTQDTGKQWLQTVHQNMEQIAGVTKVLSLVNAPYIKGDDGLLAVGTVWEQNRPWEAIQTQPMFRKLLSNETGTVQVIQVRVEKEREKVSDLQPVHDDILHSIQNHPPPDNINWQLTGVPHIRTEIVDLMLKDELFYVPISQQSCSLQSFGCSEVFIWRWHQS